MPIHQHFTEFFSLPIQTFVPGDELTSPLNSAIRLGCEDYNDSEGFSNSLASLLADPCVDQIRALVIGGWDGAFEAVDSTTAVEMLVSAREHFPNLRALFLGDMTYEESEISWINQSDVSAIFSAYPNLEYFGVRGSNGLSLGTITHSSLRTLVVECGGLPASVMSEIANSHLPSLQTLELWLGDEGYGREIDKDTLEALLSSTAFPQLKSLGLCNDSRADETAHIVAQSPILKRLETLDLSRGALGDEGALALMQSPQIKSLKKLDLHHHYMSEDVVEKIKSLGIVVDVSDPQEEDVYGDERYRSIVASE